MAYKTSCSFDLFYEKLYYITSADSSAKNHGTQKLDLKVLEKVEDAVNWANELILKIDAMN
jgi:hypothetical protein